MDYIDILGCIVLSSERSIFSENDIMTMVQIVLYGPMVSYELTDFFGIWQIFPISFHKRRTPIQKLKGRVKKTISTQPSLLLVCDPGEARTHDPMIKSHLLYQLSYGVNTHQKESSFWFWRCKGMLFLLCAKWIRKKFLFMRSCINSHDLISLMRGQCVGMSCLSVGRACRMEELELHHCRKVYDWQPRKYEPETLRLWRVFSWKAAREFFRSGVRIFSLPRQNRKVYAPRFWEGQKRKFSRVNWAGRGWCSLRFLLVGGMSVGCLYLWSFFRSNRRGLSSSIIDTIIVWILRLTERGSADLIPKEKERGDPSPMM